MKNLHLLHPVMISEPQSLGIPTLLQGASLVQVLPLSGQIRLCKGWEHAKTKHHSES